MKIHSNLNPHIIPGDVKLGNTVLIVSAPDIQESIHLVTPCEHRETILYKKPAGKGRMMYIVQVTFPTACETTEIQVGDRENIFTDTIFSLPITSLSKMEDSFLNTQSDELLSIMRKQ